MANLTDFTTLAAIATEELKSLCSEPGYDAQFSLRTPPPASTSSVQQQHQSSAAAPAGVPAAASSSSSMAATNALKPQAAKVKPGKRAKEPDIWVSEQKAEAVLKLHMQAAKSQTRARVDKKKGSFVLCTVDCNRRIKKYYPNIPDVAALSTGGCTGGGGCYKGCPLCCASSYPWLDKAQSMHMCLWCPDRIAEVKLEIRRIAREAGAAKRARKAETSAQTGATLASAGTALSASLPSPVASSSAVLSTPVPPLDAPSSSSHAGIASVD